MFGVSVRLGDDSEVMLNMIDQRGRVTELLFEDIQCSAR